MRLTHHHGRPLLIGLPAPQGRPVRALLGSPREEVEARAADLRALVREATAAGKGVVLMLEDLAYAAEAWSNRGRGRCGYCPVEHTLRRIENRDIHQRVPSIRAL
ncbi:unnamed protein product [Urochloa humidicola]